MADIEVRGLLRVRERFTRLQARSWSERVHVVWKLGVALLQAAVGAALRGLLVLIYTPIALLARLLKFRFPYSHALADNFGHLAVDPGLYLQAQAVGVRPKRRAVIAISRNRVPNTFLMELWRSQFHLVTHPLLAFLLAPLKWSRLTGTPMYLPRYKIFSKQGNLLEYGPAIDEIVNRYEFISQGEPLLTLDQGHQDQGRRAMQELGVPGNAWWVALHAREGVNRSLGGSPRNVAPLTVLAAAQGIIDRGGYVVRSGDSSMKPLPSMAGLVDYAHSQAKSEWMDIFVIAHSRFLLQSNSGPGGVAWVFGVPTAGVNYVPLSQGLLGQRDMRISKLIVGGSPPEVFSFDHVLGSDVLRDAHTGAGFLQAGVEWRDNSAEEIRELAIEMLDRLDGVAKYEPLDDQLQDRFQEMVASNLTPETWGTMSRVGRHFLRTHVDLFKDRDGLESINN